MGKWVNKELFEKFNQIVMENEKEKIKKRSYVYPTFERGPNENTPIKYTGRLLPNINTNDPKYGFSVQYFYHMFRNNEGKWTFVFCPKTWGQDKHCPFCLAAQKLYSGSEADKRRAPSYLRKEKYVVNYYCVEDPRDEKRSLMGLDKLAGKVWILEYPTKLNSKIREEQLPGAENRGIHIYDPENGYNIIILVKSTKPTKDKKVFHDYDCKFAMSPTSLGTSEEEIEQIMNSRHDLIEYLKGMEKKPHEMMKLLQEEMIWDLVKHEFCKVYKMEDNFSNSQPVKTETDNVDDFPHFDIKEENIHVEEEKESNDVEQSEEYVDIKKLFGIDLN